MILSSHSHLHTLFHTVEFTSPKAYLILLLKLQWHLWPKIRKPPQNPPASSPTMPFDTFCSPPLHKMPCYFRAPDTALSTLFPPFVYRVISNLFHKMKLKYHVLFWYFSWPFLISLDRVGQTSVSPTNLMCICLELITLYLSTNVHAFLSPRL